QGKRQGFRLQNHSRAAPVWVVVAASVLVSGKVPYLHRLVGYKPFRNGLRHNRGPEKTIENLWKQTQDGKLHSRIQSTSSSTCFVAKSTLPTNSFRNGIWTVVSSPFRTSRL